MRIQKEKKHLLSKILQQERIMEERIHSLALRIMRISPKLFLGQLNT